MDFPPNIESHLQNGLSEPPDRSTLSPQQIRELVHDLQIHQTELEMQNDELRRIEGQLRKNEERLELALEATDLGLWDWDLRTGIATRDARTAKIYGYQPGELDSSFDTWRNAVHPQDRPSVLEHFNQHLQGLSPMYEAEFRLITRSGELKWIRGRGKVVERDLQQNPVRIVGTLQDITSHKRSEEALRESEQRYRELANLLPQFVYETDEKGTVIFGNRSGLRVTGYTLEDLAQGRNLLEALIPEDRERAARDMSRVLMGEEVVGAEYTSLTKDGEQIPVITYAGPIVRDGKIVGIRGVAVDIGELKRKEDLLQASLEERNLLLREIHHRVKNNLQIMASLLALQAKQSGNQDFADLSIEARSRIMAMALVHDNLHQSPDLSRVKARDHIRRLVGNLISSYALTSYQLDVRLDLEDVFLNIETAIPLGLIVNELLSNCFKHAFPSGKQGTILLSLRSTAEHTCELRVADTGVGLPKDFTLEQATSFGINLVKVLVGQLDGEISATTTEGTEFRITFREAVGRKGKKT